jgi:hypothetical protein
LPVFDPPTSGEVDMDAEVFVDPVVDALRA